MPPNTLTNTLLTCGSSQDDVEAGGHHLGRGAAADVEEVGGLDAAVLLAGVGDDVERRHHQARAVADDADLAVELDVVEVVLLGLEPRAGRWRRGPRTAAWSGWRKSALASSVTLPSSAQDLPVVLPEGGVRTSGLTSTRVASSSTKTSHSFCDRHGRRVEHLGGQVTLLGDRAGERLRSTPLTASTGTLASRSGLVAATSSISMPPSTEHIAR